MSDGPGVVRWPEEHRPEVSAFLAGNELDVAADPERVFAWLRRPDLWPSYYPNSRFVRHLAGPWPEVEIGSRWRWFTFGAFVTSEIVVLKVLGLGTALAVLIDATIIRALLVPALMQLLGSWNWWAPAPLRRLHARIGLSEA